MKPINKAVLAIKYVKPSKGGLIMPDDRFDVFYDVIAVSDDLDSDIQIGDRILIEKYQGYELEFAGNQCLMIKESKILAVLRDN